jgi:hypothetical protein
MERKVVAYGGIDCLLHWCHIQGRLCNKVQLPEDLKHECRCRLIVAVTELSRPLEATKATPAPGRKAAWRP